MTRHHRLAHVWMWFAVVALGGCAFVMWLTAQLRGEP
jgi:hypothetical protein